MDDAETEQMRTDERWVGRGDERQGTGREEAKELDPSKVVSCFRVCKAEKQGRGSE